MSKIVLVVPYERLQNVQLDPSPQRLILVTGGGAVGAREAFQALACVPDRESCVMFIAPPSAAEAMTRALGPAQKGNPARHDLGSFETWREVAETVLAKTDRGAGKTLILIPVPAEGNQLVFSRKVVSALAEHDIFPDVICQPHDCVLGNDMASRLQGNSLTRCGVVYAPTIRGLSFLRCEGTGADGTFWYEAAQALDNLSEILVHTPEARSVAVVMEPPLAEWVQRHLLPRGQHDTTPVREGTLAIVLQLPMNRWSELDPQALWDRPDDKRARVQHVLARHQEPVATPLPPISPAPRVGPDVEKRVVFITPAAWQGDTKAPEKRGSFNTNRPKGELTAEGVRALTEVFQRLEDLDIHPGLVLASTAADATLTAERVRKAWLTSSGKPDLERLALLLSGHKSLSSTFDVLTRPQNAGVATVFVVAASPDLGRLTELMGSAQTFAPHTDVRVAQLQPGVTWADVSRFMKKNQGSAPLAACRALT